jgi:type I restriction enzyme S subunit
MVDVITKNIDIWSTAQTIKTNGRGRSADNQSLHGIEKLRELILDLAVRGKLVPQDPNDEPASVLLGKVAVEQARLIEEGKIKKREPLPEITAEERQFSLPEGWEWARIGDVGHDWGQKTPDNDFTYIEVSAIDNVSGTIKSPTRLTASEAPSRARKIAEAGTVMYSTVRPYLKNICVIEQEYSPEPIVSTAFAILHPYQQMPGKFFALYLRSPVFVRYVESVQTGIAYPAINDKQFFSGVIPIPPLAEQHRIVAKVDELMALCSPHLPMLPINATWKPHGSASPTTSTPSSPPNTASTSSNKLSCNSRLWANSSPKTPMTNRQASC